MTLDSRVCHEHFTIDDFELNYETKLPDGTVSVIPRGKAKLKPNAKPSIFPQYPAYYKPKPTPARKAPRKRASPQKKPKPLEIPLTVPDILITNEDVETQENESNCTNNNLVSEEAAPPPNVREEWSFERVKSLALPINWVVGNTLDTSSKFLACINPTT